MVISHRDTMPYVLRSSCFGPGVSSGKFSYRSYHGLSNKWLLPFTLAQHFRNTLLRTVFCETVCQERQELGTPEAAEAVWCTHEGCGHERPRECAAGEAGPDDPSL